MREFVSIFRKSIFKKYFDWINLGNCFNFKLFIMKRDDNVQIGFVN